MSGYDPQTGTLSIGPQPGIGTGGTGVPPIGGQMPSGGSSAGGWEDWVKNNGLQILIGAYNSYNNNKNAQGQLGIQQQQVGMSQQQIDEAKREYDQQFSYRQQNDQSRAPVQNQLIQQLMQRLLGAQAGPAAGAVTPGSMAGKGGIPAAGSASLAPGSEEERRRKLLAAIQGVTY